MDDDNEDMPTTPAQRLKRARLNLYRADTSRKQYRSALAAGRAFGYPDGTYGGYENGTRGISPDVAEELASHLRRRGVRITAEYILFGKGKLPAVNNQNKSIQISLFLMTDLAYFKEIAEGRYPISEKMMPVMDNGAELPSRLYSMLLSDRSMVQEKSPSFPPGMIVLTAPDIPHEPGNFVSALLDPDGENAAAVFRKVRRVRLADGSTQTILEPLNKAFEDIELNEARGDRITGVLWGLGQYRFPAELF